jgi:2-dehydro-3-deoxygluconokinase
MAEKKKVVAFGELMLRLTPKGVGRFVQADEFEARYTGAEANAAVSLVNFGVAAYAVSKVPDNEIGQACINYLGRFGVNTEFVARGGERLGLFYLETGAAQRASKIIYDRSHSAIRDSRPEDYDWNAICAGKHWFHFSGTAPALGESVQRVLEDGLRAAKEHGLTVSCDLNYRAKLWSPAEANRVMSRLMSYVDVLIGNEEDAEKVFGIKAAGSDASRGKLIGASYQQVAEELVRRFAFKKVATTLRESISASVNGWAGMLFDGAAHYLSRRYEIDPVVDRVGGGDSFTGGLIYGMLAGFDPRRCVEFAAAASCLKHSIAGDFNLVSVKEVEALVGGDASGRVQR